VSDRTSQGYPQDPRVYRGPPLALSSDEIRRLGPCLFALASAGSAGSSQFMDRAIVTTIAERLTDAHVEAAFEAVGGDLADLRHKAAENGIAALLRSRLQQDLTFDALGCATGAAEVVVGVACIPLAAAEEVGSAGLFTPGAILTVAVGGAFIAAGVAVMTVQC
jgi:hypothetical protein